MMIDLHIPSSWQEVTKEQLRDIVELGMQGLSREKYLLVVFCRLSNIKMIAGTTEEDGKKVVRTHFKDSQGIHFELADWQIEDFCNRLSYVMEKIPITVTAMGERERRADYSRRVCLHELPQ